jgi:hypothetical protein
MVRVVEGNGLAGGHTSLRSGEGDVEVLVTDLHHGR